jgi:sugar phosphate isomerase/epimerase
MSVIENHRKMGCENIGIGYFPFKGEDSYYKFIQDFDKPMKLIHDNGMKLHYHNHAFEFERFGKRTGYDILIDETDPLLLGFILDTYWVQFGGKDPVDLTERLNGRITCMHFKDFAIKDNNQCMTEVMEGNLNWDKIIASCENTGVRYALVEQDINWTIDPFTSLETSYRNLMSRALV